MSDDDQILQDIIPIARAAGARLTAAFDPAARPSDRPALVEAVRRNEAVATAGGGLRAALEAVRPEARWFDYDSAPDTRIDDGEWWVVDALEGNVNHIHGSPEWAVTVTLMREQMPVVTVVHHPMTDKTWTAVRGGGAFRDGWPLRTSAKTALDAAIVGTGQAELGQTATYARIGASVTAMLAHVVVMRMSVPSTFPMVLVAQGQQDAFWQYEPSLPGIAAGILLVTEAGGVVTRTDGSPWTPGDDDLLVSAPGIAAEAAAVLTAALPAVTALSAAAPSAALSAAAGKAV